jgi:hypothetical protein
MRWVMVGKTKDNSLRIPCDNSIKNGKIGTGARFASHKLVCLSSPSEAAPLHTLYRVIFFAQKEIALL